jgi:hypothetical protein
LTAYKFLLPTLMGVIIPALLSPSRDVRPMESSRAASRVVRKWDRPGLSSEILRVLTKTYTIWADFARRILMSLIFKPDRRWPSRSSDSWPDKGKCRIYRIYKEGACAIWATQSSAKCALHPAPGAVEDVDEFTMGEVQGHRCLGAHRLGFALAAEA